MFCVFLFGFAGGSAKKDPKGGPGGFLFGVLGSCHIQQAETKGKSRLDFREKGQRNLFGFGSKK